MGRILNTIAGEGTALSGRGSTLFLDFNILEVTRKGRGREGGEKGERREEKI